MILTASLCIEQSPILRPRMSQASRKLQHGIPSSLFKKHVIKTHFGLLQVVVLLRGDKYVKECEKGTRVPLQRTYSEELLDAQEYNKTRYLSDLKKHRQLAFGS